MAYIDDGSPQVEQFPPLLEWLTKHKAMSLTRMLCRRDQPFAVMETWRVGTALVIIVFHHRGGWDLYTSFPGTSIAESIADAERRIK